MRTKTRPVLHLIGSEDGPPTLEDLIALSRQLTGREPTSKEIEEARKILST